MTTKSFHSTDPGMPTLSTAAGGFVAFLDVMLPQLGWTIEFTNGSGIRVYRMDPSIPGSSGAYLRVDNTTTTVACKMYKTMSDIDTGTDMIPSATTYIPINNSYWQLIGDERTFYINMTNNTDHGIYGFGDYDSVIPGNNHNYFVALQVANYTYDNFSYCGSLINSRVVARNLTLAPDTETPVLFYNLGCLQSSGASSLPALPDPDTGMCVVGPAYLISSGYHLVGKLRGCLAQYNASAAMTNFKFEIVHPDFEKPLRQYVHSGNQAGAVMMIQDDWE